MRPLGAFLPAFLLQIVHANPITNLQAPLADLTAPATSPPQLQGRFLHISDLHPDQFYKLHASTEEADACHRGTGTSGVYGAETSDCDSPFALINATFTWIEENLKDKIDFVVWTGDSARHDSDEKIPRNADQVLSTNRWIAEKFEKVFADPKDADKLTIPVVATFGNNDVLPHNILLAGPNKWLKSYTDIWHKFIPEEQRHGFERGGWYFVEVIPGKLAVFSLNTLYFFDNNAAVDGCALRSEPGYEHMEWLKIQLQFMRERGMKAILMGHVPPARTSSKKLWDETCWQKYTLWLQQYRDVVVGGLYGHMNIDHFVLQDTKEIDILSLDGSSASKNNLRVAMDDELTIESANDYLEELRQDWSDLPNPKILGSVEGMDVEESSKKKGKKGKKSKKDKKKKKEQKRKKALKKMGGPWGERFQVTHISPSIVPNFFPTLRIMEYNMTGLDKSATWANPKSWDRASQRSSSLMAEAVENNTVSAEDANDIEIDGHKKGKKHKKPKKPKHPQDPDLHVPLPPTKGTPPGPAYSPQPLTFLGYTQYFANLTRINNDYTSQKWREGKHKGKTPPGAAPKPKEFSFEVEYETRTDGVYKLKDLTVGSYVQLARRIGKYKPSKGDRIDEAEVEKEVSEEAEAGETVVEMVTSEAQPGEEELVGVEGGDGDEHNQPDLHHRKHKGKKDKGKKDKDKKHKKHKKKKHHRRKEKNRVWLRFIKRAFVGTLEEDKLKDFARAKEEHDKGTVLGDGEL